MVKPDVKEAVLMPTLKVKPTLDLPPWLTTLRTLVSDIHAVPSDAEFDSLDLDENETRPTLDADTLIATDPVDAAFVLLQAHTLPIKTENIPVELLARRPAVSTVLKVMPAPCPCLTYTELSEFQLVSSPRLDPPRPQTDPCQRPEPDPISVTREDPVPTPLKRSNRLTALASKEYPRVRDPTASPSVTDTRCEPPNTHDILHATDDHENQ